MAAQFAKRIGCSLLWKMSVATMQWILWPVKCGSMACVGMTKVFYTTGRLTSEMVIKVAQMGIPVLLSRSGVTQMGLELAQRFGITTIARASGRRFHVYSGADKMVFDVKGHSEEA